MSKLDTALARLESSLDRLETAIEEAGGPAEIWGEETPDLPVLRAEKVELQGEVQALRKRATEDAELRAEAAVAVREALRDLRGAVGQGAPANA